jgi:drug/metabolite transporter (DMT)-like permease
MEGTLRLFIGFTAALIVLIVSRAGKGITVPSGIPGWGAVIWVGLFEMGITFLLWNGALNRTRRPARIGNLVYLGPFISLLWIYLILGESIRPATVAGLGIIISGILIGRGGTAE